MLSVRYTPVATPLQSHRRNPVSSSSNRRRDEGRAKEERRKSEGTAKAGRRHNEPEDEKEEATKTKEGMPQDAKNKKNKKNEKKFGISKIVRIFAAETERIAVCTSHCYPIA